MSNEVVTIGTASQLAGTCFDPRTWRFVATTPAALGMRLFIYCWSRQDFELTGLV
jgi:hypothetical protein